MVKDIKPRYFALGMALVSAAALGVVLIGQYGFGLHPCHLCIYQRWPFAINIALGLIGFLIVAFSRPMIALATLGFWVDAGIAFYHTGIERKWWAGLAGCSTPDMSGSIDDLIARISTAAVTKCDEIAWSLFGLSIANYNVIFCVVCGLAGLTYLVKRCPSLQR